MRRKCVGEVIRMPSCCCDWALELATCPTPLVASRRIVPPTWDFAVTQLGAPTPLDASYRARRERGVIAGAALHERASTDRTTKKERRSSKEAGVLVLQVTSGGPFRRFKLYLEGG